MVEHDCNRHARPQITTYYLCNINQSSFQYRFFRLSIKTVCYFRRKLKRYHFRYRLCIWKSWDLFMVGNGANNVRSFYVGASVVYYLASATICYERDVIDVNTCIRLK